MTSREHARRLMLILLSSQEAMDSDAGRALEASRDAEDGEGPDDSTEAEDRRTSALVEALMWT
jgi:hypothetical protein